MWKKIIYTFVFILFIFIFSGCTTQRDLRAARDRVTELEQLNVAGTERNSELERLLESERVGNAELKNLLNGYFEAERSRTEAERQLAERLSGIFQEGSDIIRQLIRGHYEIRNYLEAQGLLVKDIPDSSDSTLPDSGNTSKEKISPN